MSNRRYAWRPDVPDHRDRIYKAGTAKMPPVVEPLGRSNPIENQGEIGSCTGNSSTSMLEIRLGSNVPLSRLMAYYHGREIENTVKSDDGAQIRDVIKGLVKHGVAAESLWPYTKTNLFKKPKATAYSAAKNVVAAIKTMGLKYERVTDLKSMLYALSQGSPVVFGFTVTEAFENLPKNGVLRLPKPKEPSLGGHAVCAVGYDMNKRFVWVRNSWGPDWGINGLFKMPFAWFDDNRRLVDDMWTLK